MKVTIEIFAKKKVVLKATMTYDDALVMARKISYELGHKVKCVCKEGKEAFKLTFLPTI